MTFDIKSLLKNGKSADEIASLFTTELNAAIAESEKEDKKFNDFLSIYDQVRDFCSTYYPDWKEDENEDIAKSAKKALNLLDSLFAPKKKEAKKAPTDFFSDFFDFLF